MPRFILHPLEKGGSLTAVPPGRWEPVANPSVLADIELTEATDLARRGRISSIPSPWARLQLFRDAVLAPAHPFHDEALNDILDTLELVLFQDHLEGVKLRPRAVNLRTVEDRAKANDKEGVLKFARALRDLAPVVDRARDVQLTELYVVVNGDAPDAPIVCGTSPFTLFFTPETRRAATPGYYVRGRALRPLAERPPTLARYVRDVLVPQLVKSSVGDLPEMQALVKLLQEQLRAMRLPDERLTTTPSLRPAMLQPAPGVQLHHLVELPAESALALKGTREPPVHARMPLVLDNSGSAEQKRYFPWLARPAGTMIERDMPRDVLPGTAWRYDWVYPEADFLVERLLVLDAPLFPERVYGAAGDQQSRSPESQREATKVLLPLTPKFFEYFRAEDVPRMLDLKVSGHDAALRVEASLTIPTAQGEVRVHRTYAGGERFDSHLSLWPGFTLERPAWRDYYLIHYLAGGDAAGEIDVEVGARTPEGRGVTLDRFARDVSTAVYHFDRAPEFIRLKSRRFGSGAEGVILPRLRPVEPPTEPAWTVAIDFGTSNTVVAYTQPGGDGEPKPLAVTQATRFDLTRGEAASQFATFFDTFFFPSAFEGLPFATVILKGRADVNAPEAQIPAFTANIPFRGEVGGGEGSGTSGAQPSNVIVGDLKWGGGGGDSKRLTRLFLHQILQLVYAEALAQRARTDDMRIRWSYPIAFSLNKLATIEQQWAANVRSFAERMGAARGSGDTISHLDESTASLRYFETDKASRGSFGKYAAAAKLTCDVGGGTTDVTAYARGRALFRTSMLFGGRDLIGSADDGPTLFTALHRWARGAGLPRGVERVLGRYPSDHTRFTYLVRLPWFEEHRADLAGEPWFMRVQTCILYFFAAMLYNVGLRLRTVPADQGEPPDMVFFGGNGASYLNWLTQFNAWNSSVLARPYTGLLQKALEEGFRRPLPAPLQLRTSSRPKFEVVLGLLADARDPGDAPAADASAPVGEHVRLGADERASEASLEHAELEARGVGQLAYASPFEEWEISRFNRAFADALPALAAADPGWRAMGMAVRETLAQCTKGFYDNQVKSRLAQQLQDGEAGTISLFVVEATVTLRELQRALLGDGA